MYWLPKMHKTPVGNRFIVASYYCSTNPPSDTISQIFIMVFNNVESFHSKSFFYSGCKKFWVVQNYFPIGTKLNKINVKKKAKSISTFDFSTLHTTILHKLLLKVLSEIINFVFKKSENALASLKQLSIGLLRVLEEDTLLNKILSLLYLFS